MLSLSKTKMIARLAVLPKLLLLSPRNQAHSLGVLTNLKHTQQVSVIIPLELSLALLMGEFLEI